MATVDISTTPDIYSAPSLNYSHKTLMYGSPNKIPYFGQLIFYITKAKTEVDFSSKNKYKYYAERQRESHEKYDNI